MECAAEKAQSFNILPNTSLTTGSLPYAWKQADIVPIHKKGSKTDKENYRHISLTSMACKVCEKIVKQRMIIFSQDLGGLNEIQFRFLEGKINCNTAVNMLQRLGLVQKYMYTYGHRISRFHQSVRFSPSWAPTPQTERLWNRGQPVAKLLDKSATSRSCAWYYLLMVFC